MATRLKGTVDVLHQTREIRDARVDGLRQKPREAWNNGRQEQQRAERIEMLERIQRQAPSAARCAVAEAGGDEAVAELVKRDADNEREPVRQLIRQAAEPATSE